MVVLYSGDRAGLLELIAQNPRGKFRVEVPPEHLDSLEGAAGEITQRFPKASIAWAV